MKKLYFLLFSLSFLNSANVSGQTFLPEITSLTSAASINEYITGAINISNTSPDSIVLKWELIDKITPVGWDYSYCDFNTCYTASSNDGIMAKVASGSKGFIKVNVMTSIDSWSYFKFKLWDMALPAETDTIEFWFNGINSTISKPVEAKLSISPNPISQGSLLTIDNIPTQGKVLIVNSLGQQVYSGETPQNGKLQLEANWTKGVYFIRISNGSLVESRKLIVR
jgi:hypothetical protein